MLVLKKLIFALPFLLSFFFFCSQVSPFLKDSSLAFSFDISVLVQMLSLLIALILAGTFFIIFATLSGSWKYVIPIALLASLFPIPFIAQPFNIILSSGFLLSFGISFFLLENKMNTYLTFSPTSLLIPSIKQLVSLIIIFTSIAFYLFTSVEISTNGFTIPSSIIDLGLNAVGSTGSNSNTTETSELEVLQQTISPEQLQALQQNPDLLKQFGLDPKILDQIAPQKKPAQKSSQSSNPLKPVVEQQLQAIIHPYLSYIPGALTLFFFITMQSTIFLLAIPLSLVIWLIFWILEKTGFTQYTVEAREVKKLVV